jgi:alpha-L-rhamnosidase
MSQTGRLVSHTQTAYVLALSFGLMPEGLIPAAAKRLADDVSYFGHLTTGFLGTPLICQALTDHGYPEVAFRLLFNKRYPSWLYPVTMGATTIWERWDSVRPDGTFQTAGMNSFNHYAYGAVGNWLYSGVAGLRPDAPGYKKILIKPYLNDRLSFVKAGFHSVYGDISSHWEQHPDEFILTVEIPVNTTALIFIPSPDTAGIKEGTPPIDENPDVVFVGMEEGRVVLNAGSGVYKFKIKKNRWI